MLWVLWEVWLIWLFAEMASISTGIPAGVSHSQLLSM